MRSELFLHTPQWAEDYEVPIIESYGTKSKTIHAPDFTADSPEPLCNTAIRPESKWVVKEHRVVAGFHRVCKSCREDLEKLVQETGAMD